VWPVLVNLLNGGVMAFGRINDPVLYKFSELGVVRFVPPCFDWCAVAHFMDFRQIMKLPLWMTDPSSAMKFWSSQNRCQQIAVD
jgi:hypothetical protein